MEVVASLLKQDQVSWWIAPAGTIILVGQCRYKCN